MQVATTAESPWREARAGTRPRPCPLCSRPLSPSPDSLIWKELCLKFGDWADGENSDSIFEFSSQISASESLQNNGYLFFHYFMVREGMTPPQARACSPRSGPRTRSSG